MRQLVYTMLISNNHPSIHLWWKENLVKHRKLSKYYETDCKTGLFTYICIFSGKKIWNQKKKKKNQKNQKGNFKIDERVNSDRGSSYWKNIEDIEKTAESVKSLEEAVEVVNNMEKIIKSNKCNILAYLAYQQDQIFEKCKVN